METNEETDLTTKYKIKFINRTRSTLMSEIFEGGTFTVLYFFHKIAKFHLHKMC